MAIVTLIRAPSVVARYALTLNRTPPLSVAYLAGSLSAAGHEGQVIGAVGEALGAMHGVPSRHRDQRPRRIRDRRPHPAGYGAGRDLVSLLSRMAGDSRVDRGHRGAIPRGAGRPRRRARYRVTGDVPRRRA